MSHRLSDELRYRLLHIMAERPSITQRQLAHELGVSVGKVNYCLRALVDKGLVKMRNFRNNRDKLAYAYVLTPRGVEEKVNVTYAFLRRKMTEYDILQKEIERLRAEVGSLRPQEDI